MEPGAPLTIRWTLVVVAVCAACGPQGRVVYLDGSTQGVEHYHYLTVREQGGSCFEMATEPTVGVHGAFEVGVWKWNDEHETCEDFDSFRGLCRRPPASTSELLAMFKFDANDVWSSDSCATTQPVAVEVVDPVYLQFPGCGAVPISGDRYWLEISGFVDPPLGTPRDVWEELLTIRVAFVPQGAPNDSCTELPSP